MPDARASAGTTAGSPSAGGPIDPERRAAGDTSPSEEQGGGACAVSGAPANPRWAPVLVGIALIGIRRRLRKEPAVVA